MMPVYIILDAQGKFPLRSYQLIPGATEQCGSQLNGVNPIRSFIEIRRSRFLLRCEALASSIEQAKKSGIVQK